MRKAAEDQNLLRPVISIDQLLTQSGVRHGIKGFICNREHLQHLLECAPRMREALGPRATERVKELLGKSGQEYANGGVFVYFNNRAAQSWDAEGKLTGARVYVFHGPDPLEKLFELTPDETVRLANKIIERTGFRIAHNDGRLRIEGGPSPRGTLLSSATGNAGNLLRTSAPEEVQEPRKPTMRERLRGAVARLGGLIARRRR